MEKLKVSAAIIARNEEGKIPRCLESVAGWAGEIIVVDGLSTDRTVDTARSFGANVIQRKFSGSFADDRNAGLDAAKNDWVLQLDADDVVTEGFVKNLREALSKKEQPAVYKFRRKNFFLGHSMDHGGFHHYIPNLVDKRRVRYEGVVHEVPVYEGPTGTIDADIEHYPFDSIEQFMERQNRYTDIAAREIYRVEGVLPANVIKKKMIGRTIKTFFKSYIKKRGYKEGAYGLIFAVLFAWINFLKWAKYWELTRKG